MAINQVTGTRIQRGSQPAATGVPVTTTPPAAQAEPTLFFDEAAKGWRRGKAQVGQATEGAIAAGQALLGDEEGARARLDLARQEAEAVYAQNQPRVGRVEDIRWEPEFFLSDLSDYLQQLGGSQAPIMATMLAGGIVGGGVGGLAGRAALGGLLGAGASSSAFETGTIFSDIAADPEATGTLREQAGVSAIGGTLAGGLDVLPIFQGARRLGAPDPLGRSLLARAARAAVPQATSEGLTEAAQTVVERGSRAFVNRNFEILGPEGASEILNAAVGGAILGGGMGAITGALQRPAPTDDDLIGEIESEETTNRLILESRIQGLRGVLSDQELDDFLASPVVDDALLDELDARTPAEVLDARDVRQAQNWQGLAELHPVETVRLLLERAQEGKASRREIGVAVDTLRRAFDTDPELASSLTGVLQDHVQLSEPLLKAVGREDLIPELLGETKPTTNQPLSGRVIQDVLGDQSAREQDQSLLGSSFASLEDFNRQAGNIAFDEDGTPVNAGISALPRIKNVVRSASTGTFYTTLETANRWRAVRGDEPLTADKHTPVEETVRRLEAKYPDADIQVIPARQIIEAEADQQFGADRERTPERVAWELEQARQHLVARKVPEDILNDSDLQQDPLSVFEGEFAVQIVNAPSAFTGKDELQLNIDDFSGNLSPEMQHQRGEERRAINAIRDPQEREKATKELRDRYRLDTVRTKVIRKPNIDPNTKRAIPRDATEFIINGTYPVLDENGAPVVDKDGNPVTKTEARAVAVPRLVKKHLRELLRQRLTQELGATQAANFLKSKSSDQLQYSHEEVVEALGSAIASLYTIEGVELDRIKIPGDTVILTDDRHKPLLRMRDVLTKVKKGEFRSEFRALPAYVPGQKTMRYAGVGSRRAPKSVLQTMNKLAQRLASLGYTLQTGDAKGSDKAFATGAGERKEVFTAADATERTRKIAEEVHPNPNALSRYALNFMARNTNQVFGRDLDSPVDFVVVWTANGAETHGERLRTRTGGTGQAISLAHLKGIPVINMANDGWQGKLEKVLAGEFKSESAPSSEGSTRRPNVTTMFAGKAFDPERVRTFRLVMDRINELSELGADRSYIQQILKDGVPTERGNRKLTSDERYILNQYAKGRKALGVRRLFQLDPREVLESKTAANFKYDLDTGYVTFGESDTVNRYIPMHYEMPVEALRADLREAYPNGTSTMQLVLDGNRTATTRRPFLGIGDWFSMQDDRTEAVFEVVDVVRIDPTALKNDPEARAKWEAREGWSLDYIEQHPKLKEQVFNPRAVQTVFKRVRRRRIQELTSQIEQTRKGAQADIANEVGSEWDRQFGEGVNPNLPEFLATQQAQVSRVRRTASRMFPQVEADLTIGPITEKIKQARPDGSLPFAFLRKKSGERPHIFLDQDATRKAYDRKAWTSPKVEGVKALPADAFKTYEAWEDFVIAHERAHIVHPRLEGESTGTYEQRVNEAALAELRRVKEQETGRTPAKSKAESIETISRALAEMNRLAQRPDRAQLPPSNLVGKLHNDVLAKVASISPASLENDFKQLSTHSKKWRNKLKRVGTFRLANTVSMSNILAKKGDIARLQAMLDGSLLGVSVGDTVWVSPFISTKAQLEILAHEMGHVLARNTAPKNISSVYDSWVKWRKTVGKKRPKDAAAARRTLKTIIESFGTTPNYDYTTLSDQELEYITDFEEWFADQTAEWLLRSDKTPTNWAGRFVQKMTELFGAAKEDGVALEPTVEQFIDTVIHSDTFAAVRVYRATVRDARAPAWIITSNPTTQYAHHAVRALLDLGWLSGKAASTLARAFHANSTINRKIQDILRPHSPAEAERVASDWRAAVAYGFQLWSTGDLELGPQSRGVFKGVRDWVLDVVTGEISDQTAAEHIAEQVVDRVNELHAIDPTADHAHLYVELRKDPSLPAYRGLRSSYVFSRATSANTLRRILDNHQWVWKNFLTAFIKRIFVPAHRRMVNTGNAAFIEIARRFNPGVGVQGRGEGYLQARSGEIGRWQTEFANALGNRELTEEQANQIREAMQGGPTPVDPEISAITDRLRDVFDRMYDYATEGGIVLAKRKGYFPWVYDLEALLERKNEWIDMMTSPEYRSVMQDILDDLKGQMIPNTNTSYAALYGIDTIDDLAEYYWAQLVGDAGYADTGSLSPIHRKVLERREAAGQATQTLSQQARTGLRVDKTGHTPFMAALNNRGLNFLQALGSAANKEKHQSFLSKDLNKILRVYTEQMVKRTEFNRRFNIRHDGSSDLGELMADAKELGATHEELQMAHDFVDAMQGTLGYRTNRFLANLTGRRVPHGQVIDPSLQSAMSVVILWQNMRTLALAAITSLTDPIGILVRGGGVDVTWEALKAAGSELRKSGAHSREVSEALGTINTYAVDEILASTYGTNYMTGATRLWSERFFRWNMLEGLTRVSRAAATGGALQFLKKHKGLPKRNSARFLAELNVTPDDIVLDANGQVKVLNETEISTLVDTIRRGNAANPAVKAAEVEIARDRRVRGALRKFVDESILRPNAATRPIWASDPHFQLLFHLKSFMFTFHDVILRRAFGELMRHGNPAPVMQLLWFVPVALFADYIREIAKNGFEDDPRRRNWETGDYIWNALERSGLYGMGQVMVDANQDVEFGGFGVESLLGPAFSSVKSVDNLFVGPNRWEHFVKQLPGQNTWPVKAALLE